MAGRQFIQVQFPDTAAPTRDDVELLKGIFEAIVALRFPEHRVSDESEGALTANGWCVQAHLKWVAEARKGAEFEVASGASRADALRQLEQLVKADQVLSAP